MSTLYQLLEKCENGAATKSEEREVLAILSEKVGQHSYLSSLLSPALCNWFDAQVRADLSCDLYAQAVAERESKVENVARIRSEQKAEIDRLTRELAAENDILAKTEQKLVEQCEIVQEGYEKIHKMNQKIDTLIAELNESRDTIARIVALTTNAWIQNKSITPEQIREVL
jgi:septal ring factor EnvC (AmiA/AmiB activator)